MKSLLTALVAVAAFIAASPTPTRAAEYVIDGAHASINFKVTHLGVSYVYGRFNEVEGNVTWNGSANDASFEVTIETASVDTGVPQRDGHLKSDDFFNVRQHPTISFRSTDVQARGEDVYHVTGDFTMNGRTRSITLPMTFMGQATMQGTRKIGFAGELTIDRTEWGLDAWQGMVGNEVTLMVSFEANQQS